MILDGELQSEPSHYAVSSDFLLFLSLKYHHHQPILEIPILCPFLNVRDHISHPETEKAKLRFCMF
jgi:hypothetical protein